MNRNEVEKWMKDSLGSQDYIPNEEAWKKLQEVIVPPEKKNYLLLLGALPAGWKAAATVALLVSVGSLVYLLNPGNKNTVDKTAGKSPNVPTVIPVEKEHATPPVEKTMPYSPIASGSTPVLKNSKPLVKHPNSSGTIPTVQPVPEAQPLKDDNVPPSIAQEQKQAVEPHLEMLPKRPVDNNKPNISRDLPDDNIKAGNKFNIGIAAQAGRASVGNMRYQLGVVAHKNIGKFYAKATLALASTDVTSTQENKFQSISVNSATSGFSSTVEEKSVDAQYGKNILSVGVSPNIGYHITPRLALSAGLALYRNLDQSLSLQNEEVIGSTAISNNVISDSKPIGKWDAGVTGNASYNVTKKLGVDVQYRYGLSPYMYFNGQPVRNSGVSMGLNYMFGRK